jgi:hypothetical protein
MTSPSTSRIRSRINAELYNQDHSLEHKPNAQNQPQTDTVMDEETLSTHTPPTVIFKRDPYNDRIDRLLHTFLKPYAISLAKIHQALNQRQDSLDQLELHLANKTFPDNITIKNKFIEEIDSEGQTVIYTTILTNRIKSLQSKIAELHNSIKNVRQDCATVIQESPELTTLALTTEMVDQRLIAESELIILEYTFKASKDQKQKSAKKAKHMEMKAELEMEIPVSKGEKLMFTKSIKTLNNKITNLTKQLNSRGSHQKGAMGPKKQSKNAKESTKKAKNIKQTKKANTKNAKKPTKAKAKTKQGKTKRE